MALTLEHITLCIENLASKIDAPNNLLPSYGKSEYGPTSYITIDNNGGLTYIAPGDRGDDRYIEAFDLDHLLYVIFQGVTATLAMNLVTKNPKLDIDHT